MLAMRRLGLGALVVLMLAMVVPATALAYTRSITQTQTTNGQAFTFSFTSLPLPAAGTPNISVFVDLYGDYDASTEYADVTIDGNVQAAHTGGSPQCNTTAHTREYQVPASLIATDRALTVNVNLSASVTYTTCQNFNPRVVVRVVYTARPDLRVIASTAPASGSTAGHNSQFTVSYTLANFYEAFTTNFSVRIYYCPGNTTTGCTTLTTQAITDNFGANQARAYTTPTLTLPDTVVVGTRYIRIQADALSNIAETIETNNERYDSIAVTTQPDIWFSGSAVPSSGNTSGPGAQFTGLYRITNDNSTSAFSTNFVVSYYYCPTLATATASCTALGTQTITNDFNSNSSFIYTSIQLTLPAGATAGTRYIRAVLDSGNAVTENDENNNVDNDPITVGSSQKPDLTVDSVTAPATGSVANAGATFTVSSQVRNGSPTTISQSFKMGYYYCPTNNNQPGCTELAKQTITTNFAANQIRTITSPSLTMPNTALSGAGYILVIADVDDEIDEQVEDNNDRYASITVTAQPDLTVSAITVPDSGDTNGPGSTFTASVTLANAANTAAFTTDFVVHYFYCPTNTATGCVQIGSDTVTNDFDAGQSVTYSTSSLTLPGSAQSGTRYFRAVADATTLVAEGNENNNDRFEQITLTNSGPDLYINSFTASVAGDVVTYTVQVCNQGAATTAAFDVGLYYYLTAAPACAASPDDTHTITGGLAASACATEVFTRSGTPAGTYSSWIFADSPCSLGEADENNNTSNTSATVTIQPDQSISDGSTDVETPQDGGVETFVDSTVITDMLLDSGPVLDTTADGTGNEGGPAADLTVDTGGTTSDSSADSGVTPGGDRPSSSGDTGGTKDDGGCCAVGGTSAQQGLLYGLALALMLLISRRRRRRRRDDDDE